MKKYRRVLHSLIALIITVHCLAVSDLGKGQTAWLVLLEMYVFQHWMITFNNRSVSKLWQHFQWKPSTNKPISFLHPSIKVFKHFSRVRPQSTIKPCHPCIGVFSARSLCPNTGAATDAELANAIMSRQFHPSVIGPEAWEGYTFSDMEIRIKESTDLYGAVLWPSVCAVLLFSVCDQITATVAVTQPNSVHFPTKNRPWCCAISWKPTRTNTTWQTRMWLNWAPEQDSSLSCPAC